MEPHRLVATDRRWYLVAFDLDRDDWRTFRVDRIAALKVPGHTFVPRPLSNPARMVAEGITTAHYTHTALVAVKAPREEVAPTSRRTSASSRRRAPPPRCWSSGSTTSSGWPVT